MNKTLLLAPTLSSVAAFAQAPASNTTAAEFVSPHRLVLARSVSPYLIPGKPQSDTNKAGEFANLALLAEVARTSKTGEVRVIPDAGHVIQETRPDAVVTAVDELLARIKR